MKKFITTTYKTVSDKINKPLTLVMLSDLHNKVFGDKNQSLLEKIKEEKPDMILIAGDLVLGKKGASLKIPQEFLAEAVKLAPVFYAPGNHEQRMKLYPQTYGTEYIRYEKRVQRLGVELLENRSVCVDIEGQQVEVSGLVLPYEYYGKGKSSSLEVKELNRLVGRESKEHFHILLAHTPKYGRSYLNWGGDLIFSGHYHGGMVRLPFLGGIISPDLRLFPRFCHGEFLQGDSRLIVGAGIGEHTIPLRIWNPRELVVVKCLPKERERK